MARETSAETADLTKSTLLHMIRMVLESNGTSRYLLTKSLYSTYHPNFDRLYDDLQRPDLERGLGG